MSTSAFEPGGSRASRRERRRQVDAPEGSHRRYARGCRQDHPQGRAGSLCEPARGATRRHQRRVPGGQPRPNLSVAENMYSAGSPGKWGRIDWRAMRRRATERSSARLDVDVRPAGRRIPSPCSRWWRSPGRWIAAKVLVLDEPTSASTATRSPSSSRSYAAKAAGWRSCSSRTSSTRSTASATASPCCATAGWWASTSPPNSACLSWSR